MSIHSLFGKRLAVTTAYAFLFLFVVSEGIAFAQTQAPANGKVTVNYTYTKIRGFASNQFAIWIEDETGRYVRTLFVTNYTARKDGWKKRQQSLVNWVKASDIKNLTKERIDAMSGATPKPGRLSVVWDMKDSSGRTVAPGVYIYKIEGCLFWKKNEVWTGKITVGGAAATSQAQVSYYPEGAEKSGKVLITGVSAAYEPGSR
ncbi:MAG: DUF2271 domain-containing protein [Candidatus Latescibacterota bacterium]